MRHAGVRERDGAERSQTGKHGAKQAFGHGAVGWEGSLKKRKLWDGIAWSHGGFCEHCFFIFWSCLLVIDSDNFSNDNIRLIFNMRRPTALNGGWESSWDGGRCVISP